MYKRQVLKSILCLRKGDVLVLQYPLKKYYAFVCNMAHLRGCKVVTLIHDLGSFRRKKLTIPQEIARLDHSDCVIVHSERMRDWPVSYTHLDVYKRQEFIYFQF